MLFLYQLGKIVSLRHLVHLDYLDSLDHKNKEARRILFELLKMAASCRVQQSHALTIALRHWAFDASALPANFQFAGTPVVLKESR